MPKTFFDLPNAQDLRQWIDRKLHPYEVMATVDFAGFPLAVRWTQRAQREFETREKSLNVEMQLYFSCLVKKRIIFHAAAPESALRVNEKLRIIFRPVQAASCDPEEFARNYPEKRQLDSRAAQKMRPSTLMLDFKCGEWLGEFMI